MKRRVHRKAANRKAVRSLFLANAVREIPSVLCDLTFLRALAESRCFDVVAAVSDAIGECTVGVLPTTVESLTRWNSDLGHRVLGGLERLPRLREHANERKAILEYIKTNKTTFVATLCHDIRRLLPENQLTIRASFGPVAVWVDRKTVPSADGHGTLSAADRAFMKHLGAESTSAPQSSGKKHKPQSKKRTKGVNPLSRKIKMSKEIFKYAA